MSSHWQGNLLRCKVEFASPLKFLPSVCRLSNMNFRRGKLVTNFTVGRSGISCKCCWQLICGREVQVLQSQKLFPPGCSSLPECANKFLWDAYFFLMIVLALCVSPVVPDCWWEKKSNDASIPHAVPFDYVLPSGWSKDAEKLSQRQFPSCVYHV